MKDMKKVFVFLVSLIVFFSLFLLCDKICFEKAMYDAGLSENSKSENSETLLDAVILRVNDDGIIVRPTQNWLNTFWREYRYGPFEYELSAFDEIEIKFNETEVVCGLFEGNLITIRFNYDSGMTETDPIHLNNIVSVSDISYGGPDDYILYKDREYFKKWLSEDTLKWLELSEEERKNSEYWPEDLESKGFIELENDIQEWGIYGSVTDVTPIGLTMVFKQEDFIPTNKNDNWEYSMASPFEIQKFEYKSWNSVKAKYKSFEVPWSSDIEYIKSNDITSHIVDWEWLYGKLPKGKYRIVKEVKVLKDTHDYDIKKIYLHFEIE